MLVSIHLKGRLTRDLDEEAIRSCRLKQVEQTLVDAARDRIVSAREYESS